MLDSYQGIALAMPPQLRSRFRPRRALRRAQLRGCARNARFVSGHGFSHATTTPISIEAPQGNAKGTASRLCQECSIRIRAQLRGCARNPRFVSGHGFSHATTTPISIEAPQGNAKGTAPRLCEESSIRIRAWLQPCHHNSDLDSGPAGHCEGHSFAAVRGMLDSYQGTASAMPPQLRSRLRPRRALRRAQLRSRARNARFVSGHGFSHATTTPISIQAPHEPAESLANRNFQRASSAGLPSGRLSCQVPTSGETIPRVSPSRHGSPSQEARLWIVLNAGKAFGQGYNLTHDAGSPKSAQQSARRTGKGARGSRWESDREPGPNGPRKCRSSMARRDRSPPRRSSIGESAEDVLGQRPPERACATEWRTKVISQIAGLEYD